MNTYNNVTNQVQVNPAIAMSEEQAEMNEAMAMSRQL